MAALTALICLRRQDEREGQPIKGCHLESEREKWGGETETVRLSLDSQDWDASASFFFFFSCKVKGYVTKVEYKMMLLSSPSSPPFPSIHLHSPRLPTHPSTHPPLPSTCLSAVWFSTCSLVTHWAEEGPEAVEVYGRLSAGSHWWLGGAAAVLTDLPASSVPSCKDTRHKGQEVEGGK